MRFVYSHYVRGRDFEVGKRSDLFCLLLLGTVVSTMRLFLHAFEHTPLLNNVEEEFGNGSSFESQRVRLQAKMADLNSTFSSR